MFRLICIMWCINYVKDIAKHHEYICLNKCPLYHVLKVFILFYILSSLIFTKLFLLVLLWAFVPLIGFLLPCLRKLKICFSMTCGRSSRIWGLMHLMKIYDPLMDVIELVIHFVRTFVLKIILSKGLQTLFKDILLNS